MRDVLFIHHNFPGQFVHLSQALARTGAWRVFAIGGEGARAPRDVRLERYALPADTTRGLDAALRRNIEEFRRGEAAAMACERLKAEGCDPAVIVGHAGWGEMLFVRQVFPAARIASYLEFYFSFAGADVNFDPEFPTTGLAAAARVHARNGPTLFAAQDSDVLLTPTAWQASRFPDAIRRRLTVLHEGIDTTRAAPDADVAIEVAEGKVLTRADEVVTFAARNLEPYRGFHVFMRALPALLRARPACHVLILGGKGSSYGRPPALGRSWKSVLLQEMKGRIDLSRVHFVGHVPYDVFLGAMQISRAHVYLTYPFVLSWSLLEAMACGAPIVGSRTAPVEEVIADGATGRLVDFFDQERLAATIAGLLADGAARAALSRAARAHVVERFDLRTRCLPAQLALVRAMAGTPPRDAAELNFDECNSVVINEEG